MADEKDPDDGVKIYAPDRTLHAKIGNVDLDRIITPQVIRSAQEAIAQSADQFLNECTLALQDLDRSSEEFFKSPGDAERLLPPIVNAAFSIKTKAGLGGYDLISTLAKSLQQHCELLEGKKPAPKNLDLIRWHIGSIKLLLAGRVKGNGGGAGTAIMAELQRISVENKG